MTYRYFRWITSESESAQLQSEGARICERSLDTHHAHYAVLHEITAEQYAKPTPQHHTGEG